jgi:hypothetical protein
MKAYEIGQPLPSFFAPGYELCRASFTTAFLNLIYWLPSYQSDRMHAWQQAHLQYGIYEAGRIPFLLFYFPAKDWTFDISLNAYAMQEALFDDWLQKPDKTMNMLLCDCYSNNLLEVRTIEIDPYVANYIRKKLKEQKRHYPNAIEVQKQIEHIMDATTTEDMLKKITLHNAPS